MEIKRQEVHSQHVITYSLKQGVNKFGSRAEAAVMKEMQQMINRECFDLIHHNELNEVERRHAVESLIFLSKKKDRLIKVQHCANGSTQRSYMEREEVSSLMVGTELTMLTSVIEAAEGRDVATCNIPNMFIQTEVEETDKSRSWIIMKIRGILVDLLSKVVPECREYVIEEGKGQVQYL
jgi:hypothetical protein